MKTYFGCSGYYYNDWKGKFYPEDLKKSEWLPYYASHFDSVEINNTFYRMPKKETLEKWHEITPGNFNFTLKGSRYITHLKKLNDVKSSVTDFYHVADALGGKLGCILWQLPGNQHKDLEKLEKFGKITSSQFSNVIEFRHKSWFDDEVYKVMRKYKLIFSMVSAPIDLPEEIVKTRSTAYLRLHGKKAWYRDDYSKSQLEEWRDKIKKLNPDIFYVYFNNDTNANAVKNCKTFQELFED